MYCQLLAQTLLMLMLILILLLLLLLRLLLLLIIMLVEIMPRIGSQSLVVHTKRHIPESSLRIAVMVLEDRDSERARHSTIDTRVESTYRG